MCSAARRRSSSTSSFTTRKRNIFFRLGEAVETMETDTATASGAVSPRAILKLESGKRIVAAAAVFSVGRVGATTQPGLDNAGLKVDDRGRIAVDESFRTSVPHIFAAGDVIGYPSLAATSSEQGRLCACHALGARAAPMASHFPISIYSVPEISMVGATEAELTKAKAPHEVGVARYREIARGQIVADDNAFFKMLFHRDDRRRVLQGGRTQCGEQAGELTPIALNPPPARVASAGPAHGLPRARSACA